MNRFFAFGMVALLLVYFVVELGWGGDNRSTWEKNPPPKRPMFPRWRPWRPSGPHYRDPDPVPSPKPRQPERVH